ncbi:MAG: alpha/beta hydrolase, partial [Thauera sp.]
MNTPSPPAGNPSSGNDRRLRGARSPQTLPDGQKLVRQFSALNQGLTARIDPFGIAAPILHAQLAWLMHPQELGERMAALSTELGRLQWHTWRRALG